MKSKVLDSATPPTSASRCSNFAEKSASAQLKYQLTDAFSFGARCSTRATVAAASPTPLPAITPTALLAASAVVHGVGPVRLLPLQQEARRAPERAQRRQQGLLSPRSTAPARSCTRAMRAQFALTAELRILTPGGKVGATTMPASRPALFRDDTSAPAQPPLGTIPAGHSLRAATTSGWRSASWRRPATTTSPAAAGAT